MLIALLCVVLTALSNSSEGGQKRGGHYERIFIIGETAKNGVFDPSIEYNNDGTIGWMAYSAIEEPGRVDIHLAKTTDNGKTWKFVLNVNPSKGGTIKHKGKNIKGVWRNEVPTLVHDPDDAGKEWKLFWHKYFVKRPFRGKDRMFLYGWIAYKYAPSPKGPWSEEIALFGTGTFLSNPYSVKHNLNSFHPDLKNMVAYTEPGSLYRNGVIYLVLQGHAKNSFKILLISSKDHGKTWKYLGTLVNQKDAKDFGYLRLVAPSLVEEAGRTFLFLSPFKPLPVGHDGTYIFEFEDISKSSLKRDKSGRLIVYKYLLPSIKGDNINVGESDYDEHNTYGGIVMPQIDINKGIKKKNLAVLDFQIYNTYENIIKEVTREQ